MADKPVAERRVIGMIGKGKEFCMHRSVLRWAPGPVVHQHAPLCGGVSPNSLYRFASMGCLVGESFLKREGWGFGQEK